jgi:hypothetical protein
MKERNGRKERKKRIGQQRKLARSNPAALFSKAGRGQRADTAAACEEARRGGGLVERRW